MKTNTQPVSGLLWKLVIVLIGSQSKCLPCIYSNTVEGSLIFFSLDGFVAIEPNGEYVYIILFMQRYVFCETEDIRMWIASTQSRYLEGT